MPLPHLRPPHFSSSVTFRSASHIFHSSFLFFYLSFLRPSPHALCGKEMAGVGGHKRPGTCRPHIRAVSLRTSLILEEIFASFLCGASRFATSRSPSPQPTRFVFELILYNFWTPRMSCLHVQMTRCRRAAPPPGGAPLLN